jgi:hypothetical protein
VLFGIAGASKPPLSSWLGDGGHDVAASAGVELVATEVTVRANPDANNVSAVKSRIMPVERSQEFRIWKEYDVADH